MSKRSTVWMGGALLFSLLTFPLQAFAETKVFGSGGDGVTWHDLKNWFSQGVPAITDAVSIDKSALTVLTKKDFLAQSVMVGGKAACSLTVDPFMYGTIQPTTAKDPALLIRKGGVVILKGSGTIIMKGPLKITDDTVASQPSVMILLE